MKPSDDRPAALEFVETDELHVVEPRAAATEDTGVYWLAPYEALKAAAIRPSLRHVQHVQQSKGRKADKNDSLWLARICQFGRDRNRLRKREVRLPSRGATARPARLDWSPCRQHEWTTGP